MDKCPQRVCPSVAVDKVAQKCSGYLAGDFVRLLSCATEMAADRTTECDHMDWVFDFDKETSNKMDDQAAVSEKDNANITSIENELVIKEEDFIDAIKVIRPLLKTEGFPMIPDTTWEDVGGLEHIREQLRLKMIEPMKRPERWAKYGIHSSGVLLWGPPGCGKTLLAKAVANEAGVNLLIVNGPDLLSMYQVGCFSI